MSDKWPSNPWNPPAHPELEFGILSNWAKFDWGNNIPFEFAPKGTPAGENLKRLFTKHKNKLHELESMHSEILLNKSKFGWL